MKKEGDILFSYSLESGLKDHSQKKDDNTIKIRLEKNNRGGKVVTVIFDIPDTINKDEICSLLKKRCGSGGSIKNSNIEIQGDKREIIEKYFKDKNYKVKFAGG